MSKRLRQRIARLSKQAAPEEVCGFVVDGRAVRVPNRAETPTESFLISADDYLENGSSTIFHSHPSGTKGFSEHDMAVAANMELTSYVYVIEADRIERWSVQDGLQIFEKVLTS